eukprot:7007354-Prymnesium_polylepis.1
MPPPPAPCSDTRQPCSLQPNCSAQEHALAAAPTPASIAAAVKLSEGQQQHGKRGGGAHAAALRERPLLTPQRIRLALATLFVPNDACSGMRCGLLAWCSGAKRLRAAMPESWEVSLLAVHIKPGRSPPPKAYWCPGGATGRLPPGADQVDPQDCPDLRLIAPSAALRHAVRDFMTRRQAQILAETQRGPKAAVAWNDRMGTTLYKWELMAQGSAYDAVLFTDLDVELLPPWLDVGVVAGEWVRYLSDLVGRSREAQDKKAARRGAGQEGGATRPAAAATDPARPLVRMVASPDWSSPVNAGLMLLLPPPSHAMFKRGLEVLYAPFNTTHGWNLTGTPLQLFGTRKLRKVDGSVMMYAGAPANIDNPKWDFVGADVDQVGACPPARTAVALGRRMRF